MDNPLIYWDIAIGVYFTLAIVTLVPTLAAIIQKIKLNPDGDGYDKSVHFNEGEKERLKQHYSRIAGTLSYWKNRTEMYRSFNNYSLCWTIVISICTPIISQLIGKGNSNWFLTIMATHGALILGFYRGFKIEKKLSIFSPRRIRIL
jgi:hypothetical protein